MSIFTFGGLAMGAGKFFSAIIILFIGLIVAKIISKFVRKILQEMELNTHIRLFTGLRIPLDRYIGDIILTVGYFIAAYVTLQYLNLVGILLVVLIVIFGIIFLLSIFIGVRDFFPNLVSGMRLRDNLSKGDRIYYKKMSLRIESIGYFETKLFTKEQDIIYFPNNQLHSILEKRR